MEDLGLVSSVMLMDLRTVGLSWRRRAVGDKTVFDEDGILKVMRIAGWARV